jgi:hypothetical protein
VTARGGRRRGSVGRRRPGAAAGSVRDGRLQPTGAAFSLVEALAQPFDVVMDSDSRYPVAAYSWVR